MRHKWVKFAMPWQFFEMQAYKADQCERCGCLRVHFLQGGCHFNKYLLNGGWHYNAPVCDPNVETTIKSNELISNQL